MDKLDPRTDGSSPNIVEENVDLLRKLFPDAFTESSDEGEPRWEVDFDALKQILGDYTEDKQERYSLTWNGKARARRIAQTPSTGTLRPCPKESVNWATTQNLFIEGDNLEVLKLLQKSYHKRVGMIYIDPPYNTGGDFIYADNFRDSIGNYLELTGQMDDEGRKYSTNPETSGRYHTDWLNMMYPRIKLARNLLRDDGLIFISIDDNELTNLWKICDEIFGEENFLNLFCWINNLKGRQIAGAGAAKTHEYVLAYTRNSSYVDNFVEKVDFLKSLMPSSYKGLDYEVESDDESEYVVKNELYNTNSAFNEETRPNLVFNIHYNFKTEEIKFSPVGKEITYPGYVKIAPKKNNNGTHRYHAWRWNQEKILREQHDLKFVKDGNRPRIYTKIRGYGETALKDVITDVNTTNGTREVKELFGGSKYYDYPKPIGLISLFTHLAPKDSIIMDFFAGSCSTAHAVMNCNMREGINRRFVMVQLPEPCDVRSEAFRAGYKTIADIGKDRIRIVIKLIQSQQKEKAARARDSLWNESEDSLECDLGFKVFKLDVSNIKPWDADFDNLEEALFDAVDNIKPDRSNADVLYELLLKYGLDLAVPIEERGISGETVYIIGGAALVACLADNISLEMVEEIAAIKEELKPEVMRVVFKDSGFADDVVKTNAVQILRQAAIEDVKSL